MRAIRFGRDGTVTLMDVPRPDPGPEDVIVQVLAAGVCRSDLHVLEDVRRGAVKPLIPGHEIAGKVVQRGPDVFRVNVGDMVVVDFDQPCGRCRHCRQKRTNLCQKGRTLGFNADGGYAEFARARQDTVLPLRLDMDPGFAATLGCSGATAHHAVVGLGRADQGDIVVVLGAGGVGLAAIQIARAQQARVLAVDVRPEALRAADEVGAEATAEPARAKQAMASFAGPDGADIVLDFVGTREAFELGKSLLGFGGRLVLVAPGTDAVPVSANDLVDGGRSYLGTYGFTMADLARAVTLAEAGHLRSMVTRRETLARAGEVLEELAAGKIVGRAVLEPGRR